MNETIRQRLIRFDPAFAAEIETAEERDEQTRSLAIPNPDQVQIAAKHTIIAIARMAKTERAFVNALDEHIAWAQDLREQLLTE